MTTSLPHARHHYTYEEYLAYERDSERFVLIVLKFFRRRQRDRSFDRLRGFVKPLPRNQRAGLGNQLIVLRSCDCGINRGLS